MKNIEIERKFLVEENQLPQLSKMVYQDIVQGYTQNIGDDYVYRLRQCLHFSPTNGFLGEQFYQTTKGKGFKIRKEYEIELLKNQFSEMWPLYQNLTVSKRRYEIVVNDDIIVYLDIYKNTLKGLYAVEVEFDNEIDCDKFVKPDWFGREVTEDITYSNFNLAVNGMPKKVKEAKEMSAKYNGFVDMLVKKYKCVTRGDSNTSFGPRENNVVVYDKLTRGFPDWFYLNDEGKFAHGGYTAYKETYTHGEFEDLIIKIEASNG